MGEATGKFMELGLERGRDQGDPGTCRQQQARLAQGNLAPPTSSTGRPSNLANIGK